MGAADLPLVDALLRAAYRNPSDYTPRLLRQLALEPEGWLVAERDGALAGCGGATVMGTVGYIGLVGVHPALQRQGVARALMQALIDWLWTRGCATLLLDASDAGKPLYLALGFVPEDTVTVWRRSETGQASSPDPSAGVSLYTERDLPEIIAFDAQYYGAPRDRILSAYVLDDPALVTVSRDERDAISGYLVIQRAIGAVGPWLAINADASRALLLDALTRHSELVTTILAPDANTSARDLLNAAGFIPTRSLAHMRLGAPLAPSRRLAVYGQINFALG